MKTRNATYTASGTIDCEIEHPRFGWIPYTIDAADTDETINNAALLGAIGDDIAPYSPPVVDPAVALASWRKTASLPRRDFCLALFGVGILPKNDAIAAAKGDWPTAFDGFLTGLSEQEQAGAQIEWASVQVIRRNHPMIDGLAQLARLTPEQVDALFGWAG